MMESKTQDPKYIIIDGALANASSREFIPEDEPIFIIRGKDIHAVAAIEHYMRLCSDPEHIVAVGRRVDQFKDFSLGNRNRMDEPDTDAESSWPSERE